MMILNRYRINIFFMNGSEEEFECTHWNLAQGAYQIYYSHMSMTECDLSIIVPSFSIPKENVKYVMCEELNV